MQSRGRYLYQYALMNLAVLQADFGCLEEAVAAMLETVAVAKEFFDNCGLDFALNWLYHFGRAHPRFAGEIAAKSMMGSARENLAYVRVSARETGMWTLWMSALLSHTKMYLAGGRSVATALVYMVRSSQVLVERNLKSMAGAHMALAAAVWDRLGLAYHSSATCEIFLRCHAGNSPLDDGIKVRPRDAPRSWTQN